MVGPFIEKAYAAEKSGLLQFKFRHRVRKLITENNTVTGVFGDILEADDQQRGQRPIETSSTHLSTVPQMLSSLRVDLEPTMSWSGRIGLNDWEKHQNI
ncbi:hypothetical protein [Sphingobacterium sp. E70]|uniref:hypothetical protein n=1 Tax=Sphingobacterium sp. E70 TaxID=2853439 RepID=UPI00359CA3A5